MLVDFDIIDNSSRIWIYGSEQKLINEQEAYILKVISDHIQGWNSHGNPLKSAVTILKNHFIVVFHFYSSIWL